MHAIGIDIGGTKIAGGLVSDDGTIVKEKRVPTPAGDGEALETAVVDMIDDLAEGSGAVAVGVAAPGFIDTTASLVHYAPNLNWREEPVRAKLEKRLSLPVILENDANAAGWAEYRFGVGRACNDMVLFTIGTGVGGAIVAGGHLFRGGFGAGAELGHMRVQPGGLPCGCGSRGCIEQYASGRALERYANRVADTPGIGQALASAREAAGGRLRGSDIGTLITAQDPGALAALEELAEWLGQACASVGAVLDPELFVFGGGVSEAGELLLEPVRRAYREAVPAGGYHPEPEFRIAELVNDAGLVGAADLARSWFQERSRD